MINPRILYTVVTEICIPFPAFADTNCEVIYMINNGETPMQKDEQEKWNQKKSNETFNSITQKVKTENQNQTHNSRREGMGPNTKRKPVS